MINFINVNKKYSDKCIPLKNINLQISKGEVVVICGPSGAGKSTLIRSINRLETIDSGEIIVDGTRISDRKTNLTAIRAEIGMVFQQLNLYPHKTALKNIMLAPMKVRKIPRQEAEEKAMKLLEKVGLAHKYNSFPSQLSGGEQQRVAIARAIAKQPEILLCDEPTGALDSETGILVLEAIDQVNRELGTTTAVITHNTVIGSMADRVLHIADGAVAGIEVNVERRAPAEMAW